jgi:fructosamine-3-kinase
MSVEVAKQILGEIFPNRVFEFKPLSGGDINAVVRATDTGGDFVLKINLAKKFSAMFRAEAAGLRLLRKTNTIAVPEVLRDGETGTSQFLLMRYIEKAPPAKNFWRNFGEQLAALHQNSQKNFGLDCDNYIGSLPQKNSFCPTWSEFFIVNRLEPMLVLARNSELLSVDEIKQFNGFISNVGNIWPEEPAALIHGDLWSGNYLVGADGLACLIDPAVYFGHREMDVGMMHLFGGFDVELFNAYNEKFPLEKNWKERIAASQLYPLLVHLNLFGRSYWSGVKNIISGYQPSAA